jgi:hypothetical protein
MKGAIHRLDMDWNFENDFIWQKNIDEGRLQKNSSRIRLYFFFLIIFSITFRKKNNLKIFENTYIIFLAIFQCAMNRTSGQTHLNPNTKRALRCNEIKCVYPIKGE